MNKLIMMYGYNPEYENLSEEEKSYMDYIDECLNNVDKKFGYACLKAMLFILEIRSKIDTNEELSNEEVTLKKQQLLSEFNIEDKEKIESFMYACIQTMGIYSEESVLERKNKKDKALIKKHSNKVN